jgi:hypothetical protein
MGAHQNWGQVASGAVNYRGSLTSVSAEVTDEASVVVPLNPLTVGVLIQNLGDADVYLGGEDVTDESGILLAKDMQWTLDFVDGPIYAVCASGGSAELRIGTII